MSLALTLAAYFVGAVVLYYAVLFGIALIRRAPDGNCRPAAFVLFVAAMNEEAVIAATLDSLLALEHERFVICVGDDGSTDGTADILEGYADDPRVSVVHRQAPRAQLGKGDVLNDCFDATIEMIAHGHPVLGGVDPADVVVGIVDADGRLDRDTLAVVGPYFGDPKVAGVQIGVRIANAGTHLLARMQDMEFVGFSAFVQTARDRLGSCGLGGNGQFTRLSALQDLKVQRGGPWKLTALTEDLELGLALVCRGWRTRYCPDVYVAQQGLPSWRALVRQRTRWIQGHYSCWSYLPKLVKAPASATARLDLSLYLMLVVMVVVVTLSAVLSGLATLGVVSGESGFLSFIPAGPAHNVVTLAFAVGPTAMFMYVYQRHSRHPFRLWEIPAVAAVFTMYTYVWFFATVRAFARAATGRQNWVKTPRVAEQPADNAIVQVAR